MTGQPRSFNDGRRAKKDVAKYLLEDEPAIIATRRHWAVLIAPTLKALPLLVGGGWLFLVDPGNRVSTLAGLVVVLGALGYLGLRAGEWYMRHFIVSPRRMLLTSGILIRTVTLLPRRRITDLTWQETFFGQLLGYGTFRIESAGQHQALSEVTFLPHADELYRTISRLLFPGDAPEGDDEGEEAPSGPPPPPESPGTSGRHDTEPIPPPPED
jgi:membrane protein YdbS with pleckstrin-like domain